MEIKYTNIFQCKTLQNLPKFGLKIFHLATLAGYEIPIGYFGKCTSIKYVLDQNPYLTIKQEAEKEKVVIANKI
jgi:hypothetical protein